MKIKKNIGTADRVLRIIGGATLPILVPVAATSSQFSEWAFLGLLGVVPLLSGIVGYCPPYALVGLNTHRKPVAESGAVSSQP